MCVWGHFWEQFFLTMSICIAVKVLVMLPLERAGKEMTYSDLTTHSCISPSSSQEHCRSSKYKVEFCQTHLLQVGFTRNWFWEVICECKMLIRDPHLWREEEGSETGYRKNLNHHVVSMKPQPKWQEALEQILPIRVACVQLNYPCLVQSLDLSCSGKGNSPAPKADSDVTDSWRLPADCAFCFFSSLLL